MLCDRLQQLRIYHRDGKSGQLKMEKIFTLTTTHDLPHGLLDCLLVTRPMYVIVRHILTRPYSGWTVLLVQCKQKYKYVVLNDLFISVVMQFAVCISSY